MGNHGVCIPFPAQGHIRPMLHLAQILNSRFNLEITFINTYHNHHTLFQSLLQLHDNSSSILFECLPDLGVDEPKDMMSSMNSLLNNKLEAPYKELLSTKFSNKTRQPVTFMLCDSGMSMFMLPMSEKMGVPVVVIDTTSGCGRMGFLLHRQLLDKGFIPHSDSSCLTNGYLDWIPSFKSTSCLTNGYLDKTIDWIPSLKGISVKDIPTTIRTTDPKVMHSVLANSSTSIKSRATLLNTFQSLEPFVLQDLSSMSPNIFPIGPLHLLLDQNGVKKMPIGLKSQEGPFEYVQWLDSQKPNSVIYVSVGSMAVMAQEQLVELAWGLANSQLKFLWVIRDDMECSLPSEVNEGVKERGFVVSWCDQERVLAHASIGGFLTHCGWNSMIESISYGVPMICWPLFGDQVTNSWLCCNHLGIGVRMGEEARRGDVEKAVRELMEGENSKEMKKKALEWSTLARDTITPPHGSSYLNLERFVKDVLLPFNSQQSEC